MKHDGFIFPVTAEVVTAESAECGDAAERGYVDWLGNWLDVIRGWNQPDLWDLRHLLDHLPCGYAEGDGAAVPRWITIDPGCDYWLNSICQELTEGIDDPLGVTFSVHRPNDITDASWLRVCRALGWEGRS